MKKYIKIISINILIIITTLICFDYIYFWTVRHSFKNKDNVLYYGLKYQPLKKDNKYSRSTTNVYKYFLENELYHEPILTENHKEKHPILLFGCSYTWLHPQNGYYKIISELTNKPVFNFSLWGWGAQHTYYLINNPLLYKIIEKYGTKEPDIAIYTYIRDHSKRVHKHQDYLASNHPYLTYTIQNGKLEKKEYNPIILPLYRVFTFRHIKNNFFNNMNTKEKYEILSELLINSYRKIKEKYPKIKFIVLEYYQDTDIIEEEIEMFEKLKKEGIIFISTKELTNEDLKSEKYTHEDRYHPTPKAWELLVPELVKKIEKI